MRQSRRANIGNRGNTIARRWRPWVEDERLDLTPGTVAGDAAPVDDAEVGQFRLALGEPNQPAPPQAD
jgi:hypothetical protein